MHSIWADDLLAHIHLKSHSAYGWGRLTGMAAAETNGIQVSVCIHHDHPVVAGQTASNELFILPPAVAVHILEFVNSRGDDNGSTVYRVSIRVQKFKCICKPVDRIQSGSQGKGPCDVHTRRIDDFLTHIYMECQRVAVVGNGCAGFTGRVTDHRECCISCKDDPPVVVETAIGRNVFIVRKAVSIDEFVFVDTGRNLNGQGIDAVAIGVGKCGG